MPMMNEEEARAWLAERKSAIGGTDAPAIMGVNPWKSPLDVYAEKLGLVEPQPMNARMEAGLRMEPAVAEWFADNSKREVKEPPGRFIRHPEREWQGASLDYLQHDPERGWGLLEIKTTKWLELDEELPAHWLVQVQHQMEVCRQMLKNLGTEKPWVSFGIFILGSAQFHRVDVEEHPSFITRMNELEGSFWRRVLEQHPPEPNERTRRETLKALFPRDDGQEVELPEEMISWADQYEKGVKLEKEGASLKGEAQNILCAAIGDAQVGRLPDGRRFSWTTQERKAYTRVVEASTIRVFRKKGR